MSMEAVGHRKLMSIDGMAVAQEGSRSSAVIFADASSSSYAEKK